MGEGATESWAIFANAVRGNRQNFVRDEFYGYPRPVRPESPQSLSSLELESLLKITLLVSPAGSSPLRARIQPRVHRGGTILLSTCVNSGYRRMMTTSSVGWEVC